MSQKRYKVGQVVYVILSEKNMVVPFQIVEEVTKKTLQGEAILYRVVYGGESNKTPRVLSELKGEVFETLQEVKVFLMQNVTNWVNAQLSGAQKKANAWYKSNDGFDDITPFDVNAEPDVPQEPIGHVEDGDMNLVELPDGKVVKARVTRAQKA